MKYLAVNKLDECTLYMVVSGADSRTASLPVVSLGQLRQSP